MGFFDAKVFCLILFLLSSVWVSFPTSAQDEGTAAALTDFLLPEYREKDNRLQFIISGERATNLGAMVELFKPIIDIVKENVTDINMVKPLAASTVSPYPILSSQKVIDEFWSDKNHCRAAIFSTHAIFDKTTRILRGDTPVFFRSRELDIDGVGFDAYYAKKFIHVRSKVKVVIRPEARHKVTPVSDQEQSNNKNSTTNMETEP